MSRFLGPVAALLTLATAGAAYADCKDEVAAALEKQRQTGAFRMSTLMLSQDGPLKMTVEYKLPDRMRQVISPVLDPKPTETVLVGTKAWSNQGEGWVELAPELTGELVKHFDETVGPDAGELGSFECLGSVVVDGKEVKAYRGEDVQPGPKIVGKAAEVAKNKPKDPNAPVRIFYVDPTSGLPTRSVFGRASKLDNPIFKADYTYPVDLSIEAPKDFKKAGE